MDEEDLAALRQKCVESLCNSADYVLKYLDDGEKNNEINKLKTYVHSYCYLDKLSNMREVKEFINAQDDEICSYEDLEVSLQDKQRGLNSNYNNHTYMKSFMNTVQSHHAAASTQYEDPELEIVQTNDAQVDPISKKPITMPVKNKFCGHTYDMTTISKYITMKSKAKCPYVGCRNLVPILAKNLLPVNDGNSNTADDCSEQMESQDYDDSQDSNDSL